MTAYIVGSRRHKDGLEMLLESLKRLGYETNVCGTGDEFKNAAECDLFIYYGNSGKDSAVLCGIAYASGRKNIWALLGSVENFDSGMQVFDRKFYTIEDLISAAQNLLKEEKIVP